MNTTPYQALRSAVLHDWDPIGVGNIHESQNEYDAYLLKICELMEPRRRRDQNVGYLWWLETAQFVLSGNRLVTAAFADRLIQLGAMIECREPDT